MGVMITITVQKQLDSGNIIRADHNLTDTEIDYAAFDIVCHTVDKLRKEIAEEEAKFLNA